MNRSWLVIALAAALGVSCGEPTTDTGGLLSLDRPVDIAFACYGGMRVTGGSPDPIMTAQPTTSCEQRSLEVPMDPPGQEDLVPDWYGFILQPASGTVAVATWPSVPATAFATGTGTVTVIDADPLTPGRNAISVGEEPIAIATDKSGCFAVTANAGSCDLSELQINSALDQDPATPVNVTRVAVKNQAGMAILAKPAAMVAEPSTDVVGKTCAATPAENTDPGQAGIVYVAYPSCHLVAAVATSTGTIQAAIQYNAGVPTILTGTALQNVSCPAECPDAGGTLGTIQEGVRPVTLALRSDPRVHTRRLAIGADNLPAITLVELGADFLPQTVSQIALENTTGKLGVTSIALSPQIGMGGTNGDDNDESSPGGQGQYVYAVATDRTVRVVDVHNLRKECDTQVDTRFVRPILDVTRLQCFPVGDPATPPRRSGARSPGIELVGDGVPTSVAFVDAPEPQSSAGPLALVGHFAIITASNGQSFVVNVDDDNNPTDDTFEAASPQRTAPTLLMAHQLRDSIVGRDAVPTNTVPDPTDPEGKRTITTPLCKPFFIEGNLTGGGPHATTLPVNTAPVPDVTAPMPDVAGLAALPVSTVKFGELPNLRQVECFSTGPAGDAPNGMPVSELQITADSKTVRDPVFPDLRNLASEETWSLIWEGSLSQDTGLGAIRTAQMFVDSTAGSRIDDSTRPFCEMGVEPFDVLQMRGCNPLIGDADCPSGYQCFVHPDSRITIGNAPVGVCMLRNEASRLANACRDFLISLRRYTIRSADSGELQLMPRQHVLRTTPLDGCTDDVQCATLADYALQNGKEGIVDRTDSDPKTSWVCRADDTRAPVNADPAKNKRCIQTCAFHSKDTDGKDRDLDCGIGSGLICQGATPGSTPDHFGVCMEGVMPPQACVNGPQRYEVRASEAFSVIGDHSGYVHPIIEKPPIKEHGGACGPSPTASPLQIGRIPLKASACDPTADPITGAIAGGFEANPCSLTVQQTENPPRYKPGTCALDKDQPVVAVTRSAPAIKFRNRGMTLTLVDPYYPGDRPMTCPLDRQGPYLSDRIPLVFPGYRVSFHVVGGYSPLTLSTASSAFSPVFPVKVVAGPTNSIWVLDDGDFLSSLPFTRGQVYRVESSSLNTVNVLDRLR